MRRKDREVTDVAQLKEILGLCKTSHMAMVDEGKPYVVPLNFGYEEVGGTFTFYFHSAKEGHKLDILHKNPQVCFEMCNEGEPVYAKETPCNSGYYFSSFIGNGEVVFVEDIQEKCLALTSIMKQQAGMDISFRPEQAAAVCIFKIVTKDYTGKQKPMQPRG